MQNTYLLLLKSNIFPNTNKGKASQTEDKAEVTTTLLRPGSSNGYLP